ncbi:three component ABC system middle component [Enterococcus sp. AZ192]|uniref:three component ABC system middle component n=1 Tax=unclassified Enterococcus TaxID=2608891 RepID=UPI003D265AD3
MQIYNNEFFSATAIYSILKNNSTWSLGEIMLILPIVTHADLVKTIKNKKSYISFLDIVIDKPNLFYNFNQMFHSYKTTTINSLTLLLSINAILVDKASGIIELNERFSISKLEAVINENKRLRDIDIISEKMTTMLTKKTELSEIYSQLGVKL